MKKRICLLITLITLLFVGVVRVDAADITCIYGKGNSRYKYLQSGKEQLLYESHTKEIKWQLVNYNFEFDIYDDEGKRVNEISKCPPSFAVSNNGSPYPESMFWTFHLYNEKSVNVDAPYVYPYIGQDDGNDSDNNDTDKGGNNKLPEDTNVFYYKYNYLYKEEINKKTNNWIAECSYMVSDDDSLKSSIYLYFNKDKYILINENSKCGANYVVFTIEELNNVFENVVYNCPTRLYFDNSSNDTTGAWNCSFSLKSRGYSIEAFNSKNIVNVLRPEPEPEPEPVDDCKSLFGDDLVKIINKVMDWVKIIVPILLIGLGIFDFTKAIFAADEEKMKKAGKTFFNRIIAAVLVFIAPIFVNLILNLANEVWSEIKADTCISQPE